MKEHEAIKQYLIDNGIVLGEHWDERNFIPVSLDEYDNTKDFYWAYLWTNDILLKRTSQLKEVIVPLEDPDCLDKLLEHMRKNA